MGVLMLIQCSYRTGYGLPFVEIYDKNLVILIRLKHVLIVTSRKTIKLLTYVHN